VTASLTENTQREAMHPADEFEAFKALVDEGRPIAGHCRRFRRYPADGAAPPQARQRLGQVAGWLSQGQCDDGAVDGVAVTDDHAAQEQAFFDVPEWQRDPQQLREHLTVEDVDAGRDAVARFVGVQDYEQAGGVSRRDLFADEGQGVYLNDRALLDKLAVDKLAGIRHRC